jgi:hypothetical protein
LVLRLLRSATHDLRHKPVILDQQDWSTVRHSASFIRFAVLDTCSPKMRSAPARRQVAFLRRQPGGLVRGGCPRVSDAFLRERDVLTVTRPDRLARSTAELLSIEADPSKRGIGRDATLRRTTP